VTVDAVDMDASQLQREVLQLRRRIQKLTALLRVLLVVFRISGYSLNQTRLSEGGNKRSLLQAIERSRSALPLRSLLRVVRLSPVRWSTDLRAVGFWPKCRPFFDSTDSTTQLQHAHLSDYSGHNGLQTSTKDSLVGHTEQQFQLQTAFNFQRTTVFVPANDSETSPFSRNPPQNR
jgi:hypothetical protein